MNELLSGTFPSLAKEGWTRHQQKCREASFEGADGVVGSTTDYRKLNQPPRLREAKVASRNLIDRAATPP